MNQTQQQTPARRAGPSDPAPVRRVAIVSSDWHRDIVDAGVAALQDELSRGPAPPPTDHFQVPGAFEIPLLAKRLAESGTYEAVIACGFVVNGGIYRHEFVAAAVIDGLMRVQLDTGIPVFSAVLTPRDFHEHEEHRRFFKQHYATKGREVAEAYRKLASLATARRSSPGS